MAVIKAVASENKSRGRGAALRRHATYLRRLAEARTDRDRFHALVWWWMSEIKALPSDVQQVQRKRLERLTAALNEGNLGDDSQ